MNYLYTGVLIIFIVTFIITFYAYYHHYNKLAVYHKYSKTVDILVFIGASILIVVSFLFYDRIPEYNNLLWLQLIFAINSLNIHIVRFIIGKRRHIYFRNKE